MSEKTGEIPPPFGGWGTPPRSVVSRIDRKKTQRTKAKQIKFLSLLRHAFDKADVEKEGSLTFEQWKSSHLRKIIQDGALNHDEFAMLFKKIDANSEGRVDWENLVHYLAKDVSSQQNHKPNEAVNFIAKFATVTPKKSQVHREMVSTVLISNKTNEYITIASDSVRFWRQTDLIFTRSIADNVKYQTGLVFDLLQVLAVATSNRKLIFYDLETLNKLQIEVNASPSPNVLKKMTKEEAVKTLGMLDSLHPELYNMPSYLHVSELEYEAQPDPLFFVGDDQGSIEIFRLSAPKRRAGTDFKCNRLTKIFPHTGCVTQIATLKLKNCYASSSVDKTVKFWSFNSLNKSFQVLQVFNSDESIMSFTYSYVQKVLATTGISRDAFVWSEDSARKIFKLGAHYNAVTLITDYVTTSGDKYLLTMTNKKEFRIWDSQNYRLVKEFADRQILHPENRYSAGVFDPRRKVFVAASNCPALWGENLVGNAECEDITTHTRPIIGTFYAPEFNQLITVDSMCCIKTHDIETGHLIVTHLNNHEEQSKDVATACLDNSKRRLITSTFDNKVTIWNYNSGFVLGEPELDGKLLISTMIMGKNDGKDMLIRAGWDKVIYSYIEVEKGNFEPQRIFQGHSDDISFLAFCKEGFISATFSGEICTWNLTLNKVSGLVKMMTGIESMLVIKDYLIVGDSSGFIYIYTLPRLVEHSCLFSQDLSVSVALSSMFYDEKESFLYVGDTLGYMKKWKVKFDEINGIVLEKAGFWRLHRDEITSISLLSDGFIATTGVDNCVRMWSPDFDYVGVYTDNSKWDTKDKETWIVEKPFEMDPKHVTKFGGIKKTITMIRSMKKLITIENEIETDNEEKKEEGNKEEEPKTLVLDPQKVLKALDEYYNQADQLPEQMLAPHIIEPETKPLPKLPQLKLVTRAQEITEAIANLQYSTDVDVIKKKYNITDKTIRSTVPAVNPALAKKPVTRAVKLPIPLHVSPLKRKIPKLPKSAPMID